MCVVIPPNAIILLQEAVGNGTATNGGALLDRSRYLTCVICDALAREVDGSMAMADRSRGVSIDRGSTLGGSGG